MTRPTRQSLNEQIEHLVVQLKEQAEEIKRLSSTPWIIDLSTDPPHTECSALLSWHTREFWKGRPHHGNRKGTGTCGNRATLLIEARYFCRKHGAYYLLGRLLEKK